MSLAGFLLFSALLFRARAHYNFAHLIVNNTVTKPYEYVRMVTNHTFTIPDGGLPAKPGAPYGNQIPWEELERLMRPWPQYSADVLTANHRCGRDAWRPSLSTGIADVIAGESVGFQVESYVALMQQYDNITHIGPGLAYLAKKPDGIDLAQWDGDGDWMKIDYKGPDTDDTWSLFGQKQYNFTIPRSTPPGQYLLRVEHINPSPKSETEFYVNCAQVNILGPGGGTPPKSFARFPGTYKVDEPALSLPDGEQIVDSKARNGVRWLHGFLAYVPPGPTVWTG
ncbi:glycosyl hydrolase family 61-domain-containing protein [Massariosphaeria phaeospora]|uniref:lytic cellulose monooxygenase (C4-dehydrogenating) n=1 Tax=Massariosphaeria phaeospora TaxID=100035 RepID=A0A7C8IJ44_9PLEO|nr:glycosyl hydrolase family 61-domain-containing protein [Massariosphaeria phaeospora]